MLNLVNFGNPKHGSAFSELYVCLRWYCTIHSNKKAFLPAGKKAVIKRFEY